MMKKILLSSGLMASMFLMACNSEMVHNKIKDNMVSSCMEQLKGSFGEKGEEYCKCSAEEMMRGKSTEDILKLEKEIQDGKVTIEQITAMVQPCVEKLQGGLLETAKEEGSDYKKQFIASCEKSLEGQANQDAVTTYCNCSADKIVSNMTTEEIAEFEKQAAATGEVSEKANKLIQSCVDDFNKAVGE